MRRTTKWNFRLTVLYVIVFLMTQWAAVLHAASFNDPYHRHDGHVCSYQILSESGKATSPSPAKTGLPGPAVGENFPFPSTGLLTFSASYPPFRGRAPPQPFS